MGIVYLAEDGSGNEVALKVLRPEIADDQRARARLGREVRALQRMRSDNIAQVIDAELDSADAFVVTEFIPGPTLEDAVRSHGALHLEAVREIGVVLGETLEEIHAQGIVHRDLKPSNIMLRHASVEDLTTFDPDGQRLDPVIIDFGIAQAAEDSRLTSAGLMMGTAAYLDPEVVKTNQAGPAADWWAWAALIAFAASGREPFGTGRADLVFLRADRGDVDTSGLPSELRTWLRDALAPHPDHRTDPAELIERLARMDFDRDDPDDDPQDQPGWGPGAAGGAAGVLGAAALAGSSAAAEGNGGSDAVGPGYGHKAEHYGEATPSTSPASPSLERTELLGHGGAVDSELDDYDGPPTEKFSAIGYEETPTRAFAAIPDSPEVPSPSPQPSQDNAPMAGRSPSYIRHNPEPHYAPTPQSAPLPEPRQQAAPWQHNSPPAQQASALVPAGPQAYGPSPMVPGPYGLMPAPQPIPPQMRPAPKRPWLVLAGALLLIGLGAIAPLMALVFFVLLNALARAWQRSWVSMTRSRERGAGGGATSAGLITLAIPRFAWGLVESIMLALFPVVAALVVIVVADAICGWALGIVVPLSVYGAFLLFMTVGLCWIGIDGRTTRYGAHRVTDAAAPDRMWTALLGGMLVVLLIAVVITLMTLGGGIDYFPYVGQFRFEDIAPWRH